MRKKIRLSFFVDGDSIHALKWIAYFANQEDYRISLFSTRAIRSDYLRQYRSCGVIVRYFVDSSLYFFLLKPFIYIYNCLYALLAGRRGCDIAHVHYVGFNGLYALFARKKKLILSVWGSDIYDAPLRFFSLRMLVYLLMKRGDFLTSSSDDMLDFVHKKYAVPRSRTALVHHGVDMNLFKKFSQVKHDFLREKHGFSKENFVIFSPRAVQEVYNIYVIFQALDALVKDYPNIRLIQPVYGSNEQYVRVLKEFEESRSLESSIVWIDSIDYFRAMPDYYNMADVVVSLSKTDTGPLCVFEAMACEKPILTKPVNDNLQLLLQTQPDFVMEDFRLSSFIACIKKLIDEDESSVSAIGKKNRALVAAYFDYEKNMDLMDTTYKKLLS